MKSEDIIKDKIAEHQKWINVMLNLKKERDEERDEAFWLDLTRLRTGQKALEWVLSSEEHLEKTEIDKMIDFEMDVIHASKNF